MANTEKRQLENRLRDTISRLRTLADGLEAHMQADESMEAKVLAFIDTLTVDVSLLNFSALVILLARYIRSE